MNEPIRITDRDSVGHVLWRLRRQAAITPDGLAHRLDLSRSGVCRRESTGHIPAAALIEHAAALGYDVALIPRRHLHAVDTDRRTA